MAAPITTETRLGDLTVKRMLYARAGDELAVHTHRAADNHITVVSSGSFRCIGNKAIEGAVLRIGQVIDWPDGEPHGFVALEDASLMVQIGKRYAGK